MGNEHEELDSTDLENEIIVAEQLVNRLPTNMQSEDDFFSIDRNLNTEEDTNDVKSFITRDNDEEEFNGEIEELECNV